VTEETYEPVLREDHARLDQWVRAATDRQLAEVWYENAPEANWPDGNASRVVHEVDMSVTLILDDGVRLVASWAIDGLLEGLDLRVRRNPVVAREWSDDKSNVSQTPEWRSLIGQRITEIGAAWQIPNEGCPEVLWSIRLSLVEGSAIVVALGEVEDQIVQYQPDALVVLFGDVGARAYRPLASKESAFGVSLS
jgi:hypothetical protein